MPKWSAAERAQLNKAFTALSDPMRRELIELLIETPGMTVNEVCELFPVSRFTMMRHLNILEGAQILFREREGKEKQLFVDRKALTSLTTGWLFSIGEPICGI